ncbi:MAG: hypothetical protein A2W76_04985 [Gammaproteobacteria bacterium RIFCSPLOWO2_12_47_11]|nr:MAG: hypothetical protein A2W76_04985 [Gammaproteobacteria bacterium RIFCSPLOWO2_12_47_11]
MTIKEIEKEFLNLSDAEKREVLRLLIADLEMETDENVERAWLEEAQRRYKELKDGLVEAVPANESIAKAKERLRDVR